jgi:hypothetical protein
MDIQDPVHLTVDVQGPVHLTVDVQGPVNWGLFQAHLAILGEFDWTSRLSGLMARPPQSKD